MMMICSCTVHSVSEKKVLFIFVICLSDIIQMEFETSIALHFTSNC